MAELTLSEKNVLATNTIMIGRITQGLFSKANFWLLQTPTNLLQQKCKTFAKNWVLGGANSSDVHAYTRFWFANYNVDPPDLIGSPSPLEGQPSDAAVLNTAALDTVYNSLAGVEIGDNLLPIT